MDLSSGSHPVADATLLTPSLSSDEGIAVSYTDDWVNFLFAPTDEPLNVADVVLPESSDTGSHRSYPLQVHSSLMVSSGRNTITISTTFTATSADPSWPSPDIVLLSTDCMIFYVNQYALLSISANLFRGLLPILSEDKTKRVCFVQECAAVLNTILHIFYDLTSNVTCFADAATLLKAVDCLPLYGISLMSRLQSSSPLYALLMSQAPLLPYEFYAFAAHHGIEDLAVAVSPYTLQQPLWTVTEQLAQHMGPIYLKRLFSLHLERRSAFEEALMSVPSIHDPVQSCTFKAYDKMRNAWVEGVARCLQRVAQQGVELFSDQVRSIFDDAMCDILCEYCQKTKSDHLNKILIQRSSRRTI